MEIVKGQENDIRLSVWDSVTISDEGTVYFLFRFVPKTANLDTSYEKAFVVADETVGLIDRYSQFLITESDTEDLPNAIVSLTPGEWICYVYAQLSSTNTNYLNAEENVKIEQCLVTGGTSIVLDTNTTTIIINE